MNPKEPIKSAIRFEDELKGLIDYFRYEYNITYAEIIGVLASSQLDLWGELRGVTEKEED